MATTEHATPGVTAQPAPVAGALKLRDDFSDARDSGAVIGSVGAEGHVRRGIDVEGAFSIDNGALRVAPLVTSGFNRAVLGYGPFERKAGLAFAVYMLNGHNTAQAEPLPDTFFGRVNLWLLGSRMYSRWQQMKEWLASAHVRRVLHQCRRWWHTAKGRPVQRLDENLALGWFENVATPDPRTQGNVFVMHALGPENGELWVGESAHRTRALRGVQNLPLYYVAVLRPQGCVYYVAGADETIGPSAYPWLRPIGVDPGPRSNKVHVCIQQSVLGQIGWRLDSRVYGVRVAELAGYEAWCGGAHAADRFADDRRNHDQAELGGTWQMLRDESGSSAASIAVLDPGAPSGLVVAQAPLTANAPMLGLVWRCVDERNHWRMELRGDTCEIVVVIAGQRQVLASVQLDKPATGAARRLQVMDDGARTMAYVDGQPLAHKWIADARLCDATKVGVACAGSLRGTEGFASFEAHPRQLRLPAVFDMGAPWIRKGSRTVVSDDFSGERGDIDGRTTPVGNKRWERLLGTGVFELTGDGKARVRATPQQRCPDRTAYCIDWPHQQFADLEVTITPPGTAPGQRQYTTTGFILYQDPDNFITLNAYRSDSYPGGSVSTFFRLGGYEDIYDAIWSNIADRVYYGRPLRLRLCCDGLQYVVFINDEAVLYRALRDVYRDTPPFVINKVGLLANWEFSTDTGSTFEQCRFRV
jgi:hypothetical protein